MLPRHDVTLLSHVETLSFKTQCLADMTKWLLVQFLRPYNLGYILPVTLALFIPDLFCFYG